MRALVPARCARLVPAIALGIASAATIAAQTPQQVVLATQLDSPVAMAVAADGRVFITQQGGAVRIVKDNILLPTPFVVVPTIANDEEGLTGIALDPAFAQNGFVYLRATAALPTRHNQIVRYTAAGDTAVPGSATVIFDLDGNQAHFHLGSALRFGPDGKLWFATGDNDTPFFAGNLGTLHGKLLRINSDGTIPSDNPFVATTSGNQRAIYAYGLRNTFAFAIDPLTGMVFGNDVGSSQFEEINQFVAGGNYGWPAIEGPGGTTLQPLHAYTHAGGSCAITGGCFYRTPSPQLAPSLIGKYLFTEYCRGEIRVLDPALPTATTVLATTLVPGPVDLAVAPDGSLYCLTRGSIAGSGGTNIRTGALVQLAAPGVFVPQMTTFAIGCAGTLGVPYVTANGAPRLGSSTFQLRVGNALPLTVGGLHLGVSNTIWSGGSLPVDLTPLGLTGCRMLTSGDQLVLGFNGAGTELPIAMPIPNAPPLLGVPLYLQGVLLDPGINPFGAAVSAGTTVRIGT